VTSLVFFIALIREINRGYITRNSEHITMIVDSSMLLWAIVGHVIYYNEGKQHDS
jgi:RING-like zinc finger